jgi:hypothetical protein
MLYLKAIDPTAEPLRALGNVIADDNSKLGGDAVLRSIDSTGKGRYVIDNVLGDVRLRLDGPQVFLVHQLSNGATPPHYHEVDQFQVFVNGSGKIGREDIAGTMLHYADAYTTYGPIISYNEGVDYFTVRLAADCGTHYMPESRKEKLRKSGRYFAVALNEFLVSNSREPLTLIGLHNDGLAAYLINLDAGAPLKLPPLSGKGRLVAVVIGSLLAADGLEYRDWSWGGVSVSEATTGCIAGHSGVSVLCLDYPREATVLN